MTKTEKRRLNQIVHKKEEALKAFQEAEENLQKAKERLAQTEKELKDALLRV